MQKFFSIVGGPDAGVLRQAWELCRGVCADAPSTVSFTVVQDDKPLAAGDLVCLTPIHQEKSGGFARRIAQVVSVSPHGVYVAVSDEPLAGLAVTSPDAAAFAQRRCYVHALDANLYVLQRVRPLVVVVRQLQTVRDGQFWLNIRIDGEQFEATYDPATHQGSMTYVD